MAYGGQDGRMSARHLPTRDGHGSKGGGGNFPARQSGPARGGLAIRMAVDFARRAFLHLRSTLLMRVWHRLPRAPKPSITACSSSDKSVSSLSIGRPCCSRVVSFQVMCPSVRCGGPRGITASGETALPPLSGAQVLARRLRAPMYLPIDARSPGSSTFRESASVWPAWPRVRPSLPRQVLATVPGIRPVPASIRTLLDPCTINVPPGQSRSLHPFASHISRKSVLRMSEGASFRGTALDLSQREIR